MFVMAKAAELRADDLVFADLRRRKVGRRGPGRGQSPAVCAVRGRRRNVDIFGMHEQLNLPVDRHIELRGHDIVARLDVVRRVETEEVRVASSILSGCSGPNFPSTPG